MLKTKTAQIVEENKLRRRAEEEMLVYKNKAQTKKSTLSAGLEAEVNAYKVFICVILHTFVGCMFVFAFSSNFVNGFCLIFRAS